MKHTFTSTRLCIVRVALFSWLALIVSVASAQVATATYTLDNVIMHNDYTGHRGDNDLQMTGTFTWAYDVGDFENGDGTFSELFIPWLAPSDYDLLTISFDIGKSIEFTRGGISGHDAGIDVILFFEQALTPTGSTLIDLDKSKFDIGGNGFIKGYFTDGSISSVPIPDGDVDGDGLVDVADLLIAMQILNGQYIPTQAEQNRWDVAPLVNGSPQPDGQNTLGDYVVLQQKVIGQLNF